MDIEKSWNALKNDQRVPMVLLVVIAVLLIYYLYSLASDFSVNTQPQVTTAIRVQPVPQVSQWHIFGRYDDSTQVLPITQLQLTLQGIMLSPADQKHSYVIIQSPSVPAKVYKVGDELPGDATLEKIQKSGVVINYQGSLQSLLLPVPKLQQAG